jgi:hypothetical protein
MSSRQCGFFVSCTASPYPIASKYRHFVPVPFPNGGKRMRKRLAK